MTPHIPCTLILTAVESKEVEDRVPLARANQLKKFFLLTATSMFNGSFEHMQDDKNMHMCVCMHVCAHMCAIQFVQRDILYININIYIYTCAISALDFKKSDRCSVCVVLM